MAQGQTTEQHMRIRDWKGLMAGESLKARMLLLLAMSFAVVSMAFVQMGFLCINLPNNSFGYAMGLLAPVAVTSLLLGKGWGAVEGAFAGLVMYVHAMLQPLDVVEKYMVSFTNSVFLYTLLGFLLGLSFAIALRNAPKAKPRYGCIAIVSLIASLIASLGFYFFSFVHILLSVVPEVEASGYLSQNTLVLLSSMGSVFIQYTADALILFVSSIAAAILYRQQYKRKVAVSINYVFRTSLLVVVVIAFAALSAVSFAAVTMETEKEVDGELTDDIGHFVGQIESIELSLGNDGNDPSVLREALLKSNLLKGYTVETDGTSVVFVGDEVVLSNNPAYKEGDTIAELYGEAGEDFFKSCAQSGNMVQVLYNVDAYNGANELKYSSSARELGYMKLGQKGQAYALLAIPSSMVFSGRGLTLTWITISVLVMLVAVYVLAATLLKRIVVTPIERTNASLARITEGHLSETVQKGETVEFDSLSDGINTTVEALEGWIDEAERRNERDLATAKTIQESALPSTFPPFPEIDKFDIFASMNAAKEVGGDFYDFFLIDDRTLGFLIADVSGKGIPGALFMMAAKTEIENYMSTGMAPAEAIASANRRLCANNDAGMFVTVWAATLVWETGELTYVNAGHNFPLLRHGQGGEWEWLTKKCGLFLGTFETAKYRQETLTLEPGDELLLYTDGVNEAFNVDDKEYGNDRLEAFLAAHTDLRPREMVGSLRADVAAWAEGAEQSDDVTILSLEYGVAAETRYSMDLVATLDNLNAAVDFVVAELDKRLCPPIVRNKVVIALEELFVNVCRYAYANQEEPGEVNVSYVYRGAPSRIVVELKDQGTPFNPLLHEDPARPSSVDEAKIGGLGIFMVKKSMDDFSYTYDEATKSNVVVFRKDW